MANLLLKILEIMEVSLRPTVVLFSQLLVMALVPSYVQQVKVVIIGLLLFLQAVHLMQTTSVSIIANTEVAMYMIVLGACRFVLSLFSLQEIQKVILTTIRMTTIQIQTIQIQTIQTLQPLQPQAHTNGVKLGTIQVFLI